MDNENEARPWVRFFARMIDYYAFYLLISVALPTLTLSSKTASIYSFSMTFLWIFLESLLLSTYGTTPGKWFLKIELKKASNSKLTYSEALKRSFAVWWRGMGVGFPLLTLITFIIASRKLEKNGITSWDRNLGTMVVHKDIGSARALIVVLLVMYWVSTYVWNIIHAVG